MRTDLALHPIEELEQTHVDDVSTRLTQVVDDTGRVRVSTDSRATAAIASTAVPEGQVRSSVVGTLPGVGGGRYAVAVADALGHDGRHYRAIVAVPTRVETTALGRSLEFALHRRARPHRPPRGGDGLRRRPGPAAGRPDARPGGRPRRLAARALARDPGGRRRAGPSRRDPQRRPRAAPGRRRVPARLRRRRRPRAAQPPGDDPHPPRPPHRGPPARRARGRRLPRLARGRPPLDPRRGPPRPRPGRRVRPGPGPGRRRPRRRRRGGGGRHAGPRDAGRGRRSSRCASRATRTASDGSCATSSRTPSGTWRAACAWS